MLGGEWSGGRVEWGERGVRGRGVLGGEGVLG